MDILQGDIADISAGTGNDPVIANLLLEDEETALELQQQEIIDAVVWMYKRGSDSYQKQVDIIKDAKIFFNNLPVTTVDGHNVSYESWMSQINFPKFRMHVERFTASMEQYLTLAGENWFTIDSYNTALNPYYSVLKRMLNHILLNDKVRFVSKASDLFKSAIMANTCATLITWNTMDEVTESPSADETELYNSLSPFASAQALQETPEIPLDGFEPISVGAYPVITVEDPENIVPDPTGRERYVQRIFRLTPGEFRKIGYENGYINIEEIAENISSKYSGLVDDKPTNHNITSSEISETCEGTFIEHFGDVYDTKGNIILENAHVIVANERYLALSEELTFAHQDFPLLVTGIFKDPFSPYYASPMTLALGEFQALNDYLNRMIDLVKRRVYEGYEVNIDVLERGERPPKTIMPGKVYMKEGPEPLITPISFSELPQSAFFLKDDLVQHLNEDTGLGDRNPPTRTRRPTTASETNMRMADTGTLYNAIFKNIEERLLRPLLRQVFYNMLQYTPQEYWKKWIYGFIAEIKQKEISKINKDLKRQMESAGQPQQPAEQQQPLPQQEAEDSDLIKLYKNMAEMSAEERLDKFGDQFIFKTEVFSAIYNRSVELEKATYVLQTFGSLPMAMANLNLRGFMGRIIRSLGYSEEECLNTPEETKELFQFMSNNGYENYFGFSQEGQDEPPEGIPPPNALEGIAAAATGGMEGGMLGGALNIPDIPTPGFEA